MQIPNDTATADQMCADALHRYISSPVQPTPSNSEAYKVAHQAQIQQAMNAIDAVMGNCSHLCGDEKENSDRL